MKFENIVKKLKADSVRVYQGEFEYKPVMMVSGTALIDLVDGEVVPTTAKYTDVVKQIRDGKSHIMTITKTHGCVQKRLTEYQKL